NLPERQFQLKIGRRRNHGCLSCKACRRVCGASQGFSTKSRPSFPPRREANVDGSWNPLCGPDDFMHRGRSNLALFLKLAVLSFEQAVKGQVLVQIGPMKAEWRNLDMVQVLGRANRQTGILRDRKTNFPATF